MAAIISPYSTAEVPLSRSSVLLRCT
jgi:hypothetical protein